MGEIHTQDITKKRKKRQKENTLNKTSPDIGVMGMFATLLHRKWEKAHETGAFDGKSQFTLMPGAGAGALVWHNFSEG
jgi:hypothetical protein